MKVFRLVFLFSLAYLACKDQSTSPKGPSEEEKIKEYQSSQFQFHLEYPDDFKVFEDSLPAQTPVINVVKAEDSAQVPLGIHEGFDLSYLAFLPRGFGVDGPAGEQHSLEEYGNRLPLSFDVDEKNSRVYLLENGKPWGYFLVFQSSPESWGDYGGIFLKYKVEKFKAICRNAKGKEKPVEQCDPLAEDKIEYSGEITEKDVGEFNQILESLYFTRKNQEREPIDDLINVEVPMEGSRINSPLEISGQARGQWFFEATAPVELLDGNFRKIAQSYISAEGDWMTQDFVPLKGELDFERPKTKNGYLVLKRANASGLPEMDRKIRIPVIF